MLSSPKSWVTQGKTKVFFLKQIFYRIKNIWHPEIFQGIGKKNNYFEGWYYKFVDKAEKNSYAVIVGLSLAKEKSHVFIQVLNGTTHVSRYFTYGLEDFSYSPDKFEVRVKDNYFSAEKLILNLEDGKDVIKAELEFAGIKRWPVTLFSPGIMGWYTFIPFMECYHGIVGLNYKINGSFSDVDRVFDFSGGKAYIEKDRGSSMPETWIWMQSNHFEEEDASLTFSIAKIPWLGYYFPGFIGGFWLKGKLYKFTTYNGTRLRKLEVKENSVELEMSSRKYSLKIMANRKSSGLLSSPLLGEMKGRISESLNASINIELTDKKTGLIFKGVGRNCGLEVVGDTAILKKNV